MKKRFRTITVCAAVLMALEMPLTAFATGSNTNLDQIQAETDKTNQQITDTQNKRDQAAAEADALQGEADALEAKLGEYTNRLSALNDKIDTAKAEIDSANAEIDAAQDELEAALIEQEGQYDSMKDRIQYIYEVSAGQSMMAMLLSSGSFSEFLNRLNYVTGVLEADRTLFEKYQTTVSTIAEQKGIIEDRKLTLSEYQESLKSSQEELDALVGATGAAADAKNSEAAIAAMSVAEYEAELKKLAQKKAGLEAQAAEAQAALAQQISAGGGFYEDTSGAVSASESDILLLAATIQAEADNQGYVGRLAVGSVIMNRVNSSKFPNSIYGVITAPKQFTSWSSGMVSMILARGPNEGCLQVAREVVAGKRNGNWLFFMTPYYANKFGIVGYQVIGDHAFFLEWRTSGSGANGSATDTPASATYTVTFNDNLGNAISSSTVAAGQTVTVPAAPERSGYTFTGWSGGVSNGQTITVSANATYTANYTAVAAPTPTVTKYTVTFVTSTGQSISSTSVDSGKTVTIPAAPTITGYTFTGWSGGVSSGDTVTVTGNVTYTANYNQDETPAETPSTPSTDEKEPEPAGNSSEQGNAGEGQAEGQ